VFSLWKAPKIQCLAFESGSLYFQSDGALKLQKSYRSEAEIPQDDRSLTVKLQLRVSQELTSDALWQNRAQQLFQQVQKHLYSGQVEDQNQLDSLAQLLDPIPLAQELRRAPRAEKRLRATSHQLPGFRGTIVDLSLTGLGMLVEREVPAETRLEFTIDFEEQRSKALPLTGRVCWCRPEQTGGFRIGIEFVGLSQQQSWELRQVVEKLLRAEAGGLADNAFLRG